MFVAIRSLSMLMIEHEDSTKMSRHCASPSEMYERRELRGHTHKFMSAKGGTRCPN